MTLEREPCRPTERQRWIVAQRLAHGDEPEQAAAWAGVPAEAVDALLGEPRFHRQLAAERRLLAMPGAEWAARLEGQMRQATERALADGKVSTVNTLLRASLVLPALAAKPAARAATLAQLDAEEAEPEAEAAGKAPAGEPPAVAAEPAGPPAVEADPAREARRRAILAGLKPWPRESLARAPLHVLEHFVAATDPDPAVYERWRAAQPEPPAETVELPAEEVAAIRRVTRHNPPWLKGDHLGHYRAPVLGAAFAADAAGASATRAESEPEPQATTPAENAGETLGTLQSRVQRLLNRAAPRASEELDLAEAICALRWPKWPAYHGAIDGELLRRALAGVTLDADTLHWLGSDELARACRAAGPRLPQGP